MSYERQTFLPTTRELILDELRRSHTHQLKLVEENDDKAETVMRLGVFTITGVAVFLTYAVRPDASLQFSGSTKWLITAAALLQVLSFFSVLKCYGVIGESRTLSIGTNLESRRGALDRPLPEVEEVVVAEYRKAIRLNSQTFTRISRLLACLG